MKVVVADTSPLNYLVQIGEVGILRELYGTIVIPVEVFVELSDSDAPIAFTIGFDNLQTGLKFVPARPIPMLPAWRTWMRESARQSNWPSRSLKRCC